MSWLQRVLLHMYMYNPGSPFLRILEAYMAQSYMYMYNVCILLLLLDTCT